MRIFLTVEEAARLAEVSPTTYTRWEQGHQRPHLGSLGRLCKVFKATPAQLGFDAMIGGEEMSVVSTTIPEVPHLAEKRAGGGFLRDKLTDLLHAYDAHKWLLSSEVDSNERSVEVVLSRPISSSALGRIRTAFSKETGYSLTFKIYGEDN
jgi:transcriptional regulator with XRE-family HTH domain